MKQFACRHAALALTACLALLFMLWPQLDLALAARFYVPGHGFTALQAWWIDLSYVVVARFWILVLLFGAVLLLGKLPRWRRAWARERRIVAYLLVALLLGPGLIVNAVLKDHWGRARPVQLAQFGGQAQFTPALQPSNQCPRNCAFVSGHAAAAFYVMAGYWVNRRRRWLAGGIGFGLLVGLARMAVGAHFLSDVLFAGIVVYFSCRLLAWVMLRAPQARSAWQPHPFHARKRP